MRTSGRPVGAAVMAAKVTIESQGPVEVMKVSATGCPGTVTPFHGEHDAGVQALNTSNFPDQSGPLRQVGS